MSILGQDEACEANATETDGDVGGIQQRPQQRSGTAWLAKSSAGSMHRTHAEKGLTERGREFIDDKHSNDAVSPPAPPRRPLPPPPPTPPPPPPPLPLAHRVCMNNHTQGERCSKLGRVLVLSVPSDRR